MKVKINCKFKLFEVPKIIPECEKLDCLRNEQLCAPHITFPLWGICLLSGYLLPVWRKAK